MSRPPSGSSGATNPGSRRDPIERQRSFPKSYIESTHRREWFENHEKVDENSAPSPNTPGDTTSQTAATAADTGSLATSPNAEDLVRDFVVVPPISEEDNNSDRAQVRRQARKAILIHN